MLSAFDTDPFGPAVRPGQSVLRKDGACVDDPAPVRKPAKQLPGYTAAPAQPGKPMTVTLPYPPTANLYWRTRVLFPKMETMAATYKAGGVSALYDLLKKQTFVNTYLSAEGKAFKEAVMWLLHSAGVREPIKGRVQVDLQLWPKRPLDWATRARKDPLWADTVQRIDLDNSRKALYDALKGIAFGDDKCVWKDSGEVMEPDGRDACLVVTITPLVKVNPQEALQL